ncbi:hypothetical protein IEN85_18645 [Pelagicoccus sp. NFK12]|uniref:Uncharacterized protein n=1 Tax=Pelagicoccus enzymogenes TaxID=2773457 RepID=A0A927IGT8_9BACT|nr:hypothetical protein [Pelagicoccus enzymogenes]MBD5781527.1 hypothetical protein [Pelagicoccus enzymogenes]
MRRTIIAVITLLGCYTLSGNPLQWPRPHDPAIAGFTKGSRIGNHWTIDQLTNELKRASKQEHTVWYYLGSTKEEHIFMSIDYASPLSMYDEDTGEHYSNMGPFIMLVSVSESEIELKKRMKLTEKSEKWIELDSLKNITHIKSVLTTATSAA